MKERPIIMSGPEVRAIIEGRKTQTRRLIRGVSPDHHSPHQIMPSADYSRHDIMFGGKSGSVPPTILSVPYHVGDRLWVKETWCLADPEFNEVGTDDGRPRGPHGEAAYYAASDVGVEGFDGRSPWKSSSHMPRWASRITLEITEVRVQRLQEISEADARAEGAEPYCDETKDDGTGRPDDHRAAFADLWNGINAKSEPWDSNPWVWAISFVRVP